MSSEHDDTEKNLPLRGAALARLASGPTNDAPVRSADELLHELRVHQIELEMQNESLRQARVDLEESRDRYIDLFDFAPVGYLTITEKGLVREANLTACTLLGVERTRLLHHRFDHFLGSGESDRWNRGFHDLMQLVEQAKFEFMLERGDGSLFHALLEGRRVVNRDNVPELRITMTDISETVASERELAVHREHLEQLIAARNMQLAASEDKVSGLMGQSLAGVYILQDGSIRYANRLFAEIFGYASPLDMVDRIPFSQLITTKDSERVFSHVSGIETENSEGRYCFVGVRRDGSPVHVEVHSRNIEHLGKPATLGIILDISARKRAQDERQEIEAWLRGITDHAAAVIFLKNLDGRYLFVNRHFERIFHVNRATVRGKSDHDIFPPDIANAFTRNDQAVASSGRSLESEELLQQDDGKHTYLSVKFPLKNSFGKIYAIGGIATDITEHKRAQLKGTQLLQRIELLMKHAKDSIMMIDSERCIVEVSDGCLDTYGYTREEMLAMKAIDLQAPEVRAEADHHFQRLIEEGSGMYETRHCRKDGSRFPVEVGATMIGEGKESFVQVIIRDISERVREHVAMQQELAAYSHRLELASRRLLVVQEEAKRRLSAELHDRTSPNLAAIGLNLSLVTSLFPAQSKEWAQYLEDLRALVHDTEASIREICAELRPPTLDYAGLQAALDGYVSQFAKRTGIGVVLDCTKNEKRLAPAVESLLFRICQEALTNCVKHAHAKSVTIKLRTDADPITLTIADDGDGFDMKRMQLDGEGNINGLGLLNMREMTEFSGGHFTIESKVGKGTRIEVRI